MKKTTRHKVLLCFISSAMLYCNLSFAEITAEDRDSYNAKLLELAQKQNGIKASRRTVEGKLASCNLDYQFSYRDFAAKQGAVVVVVGAFNNNYFKGKQANYAFKLVPKISNIETQDWKTIDPAYTDIFIKNKSISKYKSTEFPCESGGKCKGYSDPNLEFTSSLLDTALEDMVVKFSLAKGGLDQEFNLSKLANSKESAKERLIFSQCMLEVLGLLKDDMEKLSKSK